MKIYRWVEIIEVDKDGDAQIWVILTLRFENNYSGYNYLIQLEISPNVSENSVEVYPKQTIQSSFIEWSITTNNQKKFLNIFLDSHVSEYYHYYDLAFNYKLKYPGVTKKIEKFYEDKEKWMLTQDISIWETLSNKIRLAIILPKESDILSKPEDLQEYSRLPPFIANFLKLTYSDWSGKNHSSSPIPLNSSVFKDKLVLAGIVDNDFQLYVKYSLPTPKQLIISIIFLVISTIPQIILFIKREDFTSTFEKNFFQLVLFVLFELVLLSMMIYGFLLFIDWLGIVVIKFSTALSYSKDFLTIVLALIAIFITFRLGKQTNKLVTENKEISQKTSELMEETRKLVKETKKLIEDFREEQREVNKKLLSERKTHKTARELTETKTIIVGEKINRKRMRTEYSSLINVISEVLENKEIDYRMNEKYKGTSFDFIIKLEDIKIPVELKVYPKRIIANNLVKRIAKQLNRLMKMLGTNISILIIKNPGITEEAKNIIMDETQRKTIIVQGKSIEEIKNKFMKIIEDLKKYKQDAIPR